jgi:hypothetical protein
MVCFKKPFEPMQDFTLDDLSNFAEHERQLLQAIFKQEGMVDHEEIVKKPSNRIVQRVLDYNRAYSVKENKYLPVQMLLN